MKLTTIWLDIFFYRVLRMNFSNELWTNIKSYLINYELIHFNSIIENHNALARLSKSYIKCSVCERVLPLNKFNNHIKTKSHTYAIYKVKKDIRNLNKCPIIEKPYLMDFSIEETE